MFEALQELDRAAADPSIEPEDQMSTDRRKNQGGRTRTQIKAGVADAHRVRSGAERSMANASRHAPKARTAISVVIDERLRKHRPQTLEEWLWALIRQAAATQTGSAVVAGLEAEKSIPEALASAAIDTAIDRVIAQHAPTLAPAKVTLAKIAVKAVVNSSEVAQAIASAGAVALLIAELKQMRQAMGNRAARRAAKSGGKNKEAESGWNMAVSSASGARALSPQQAGPARQRVLAAAAPAFAAALDRAVDANLLTRFAATRPNGVDAGKLRAAYAETANRAFASDFVRLVGGRPPASAEDIALGAIIAVAIARTTARFPIVPPAAIAPMAVLVHRALRPQLPTLARMAAALAAAPRAAPQRSQPAPTPEMAW